MEYWNNIAGVYDEIVIHRRDPRVDNWFLMSSPIPTMLICLSYVFLVKSIGPYLMKNRDAFKLNELLVFYNGCQVIFSAWLFYEYGMGGWFRGYSFTCQPVDYGNNEMAIRMVYVCWWYYFSKFTEFIDTFFFVLRKKNNQISTLHVIHHGCMPLSVWFGVKLTPGGHSTFFGLLNTFVHIIMYFYYMIAAMGPKYQKYIWWKKYLTSVQMVQFVMIAGHCFQLLFIECDFPIGFVYWIGGHGLLFLVLFSNFYKKSYKDDRKSNGTHSKSFKQAMAEAVSICNTNYDEIRRRPMITKHDDNENEEIMNNSFVELVDRNENLRKRE